MDKDKLKELEVYVREAGEVLLKLWPGNANSKHSLLIEKKADNSFVTEADYASNDIIVAALKRLFPQDEIVSEELADPKNLDNLKSFWLVDPLDGTSHFIEGRKDFSILLTHCVDAKVDFGLVYLPALAEYAWAAKGHGAYLNDQAISVSSCNKARAKSVCPRNLSRPESEIMMDETMDSCIATLRVASGVFDGLIVKIRLHKMWDISASIALIEEAGGRVSDEKGNAICVNNTDIDFQYMIASNACVHEELLELL